MSSAIDSVKPLGFTSPQQAVEVLKEMIKHENRECTEYSKYPVGSFSNDPIKECAKRINALEKALLALEKQAKLTRWLEALHLKS